MSWSHKSADAGGIWAMMVGGMLLVVCCAAPVALAGGVFTVLGATLRMAWLVVGGAMLVAVAARLVLRHSGRRTAEKACSPGSSKTDRRPGRSPAWPSRTSDMAQHQDAPGVGK